MRSAHFADENQSVKKDPALPGMITGWARCKKDSDLFIA